MAVSVVQDTAATCGILGADAVSSAVDIKSLRSKVILDTANVETTVGAEELDFKDTTVGGVIADLKWPKSRVPRADSPIDRGFWMSCPGVSVTYDDG